MTAADRICVAPAQVSETRPNNGTQVVFDVGHGRRQTAPQVGRQQEPTFAKQQDASYAHAEVRRHGTCRTVSWRKEKEWLTEKDHKYERRLSKPRGEVQCFWLPYLVLLNKFELFIPWWLENRGGKPSVLGSAISN